MKNVLCVIESLGRGGGAEQLLISLLPELKGMGVRVDVATLFSLENDLGDALESAGINVFRLNVNSVWSVKAIALDLMRLIKSGNYDVVWGHLYFGNLYACFVAQSLSIKCVVTMHSEGYAKLDKMSWKEKLMVRFERFLVGRSDAKVAVSQAVKNDYATFFGWDDIAIVYNGIESSSLIGRSDVTTTTVIRKRYELSDSDFLLVTPARFVDKKGHIYLLEAMKLLKQTTSWCPKLIACGQGPLKTDLLALVVQLNLQDQVQLHDPIEHEQLMMLVSAADAVVLPSLREPFGIAAAEAMALGRPTVLTKVDGFLELVGDSDGAMMVPAADSGALKSAIWNLYSEPEIRERLGASGQRRVREHFDISVCAREWVKVFQALKMASAK